jgi:hypothetical protein
VTHPRIFVLDLKSDAVDRGRLVALSGVLSAALQKYPELDVLSTEDVRRALEVDADRKTAGCDASTSCLAEIAAGLGASLAISGDVEKLGQTLVVNLNLFDTEKVTSLGRVSLQVSSLDEVPRAVGAPLRSLLAGLYRQRGWTLPPDEVASQSTALPMVTAVGGGVAVVAGAVVAVLGFGQLLAHDASAQKLAALEQQSDQKSALASAAKEQQTQTEAGAAWNSWGAPSAYAGTAVAVVGVAALVGGIAWLATSGGAP